ncbi:putative zinc finger protein At1g68190 isoform X1 [Pyrus x bretschneideri]|uniref:putative zinc finger protein At1g68190 isoform X1 n=1 Tax=Pyrus x bretschneideri TaxID=225117 RepID=UPI00202F0815|nr:putative zinc finger protein At1g68190 isoform X1 [Pyrus x bretschneideri]XP_048440749.1 putative zinc finger protein At1g68190 isoform X1 [Pyrus x bretschneideri]XP_048440750.1 putative zinc finger protein At1g68190 isoform X1 [Pyrus x bretschneideri]XP_048440751.1 putative zinc finger protein At1g68190 isoform X1 [Pyrus x bretschneideri]
MEKFCEFCLALRPVVYCKADAALLCLSCDAKVHSANTLFNRHLRSILCDLCRHFPACIQCLDHKMFMCRACDRALHTIASQHPKRAIGSYTEFSYTGSPSAEDFAALWGFKLNETDNCSAHLDLNGTLSNSCGSSCDSSAVNLDSLEQSCSRAEGLLAANSLTRISGAESEAGSSSQQYKISPEGQENNFILHQILDLKRIQFSEGNGPSLLIPGREQSDLSSSVLQTSKRLDVHLDQRFQHSQNAGIKFKQRDSPVQELKVDHLSFPFSQMEHNMQPSSTAGLPLHTESFWQCRSPVQSNQLWPQNMQDIGVCEELVCPDDFNIPDVDLTFQNFDELFGGDQDPITAVLHDKDVSYSSVEKGISLDKQIMAMNMMHQRLRLFSLIRLLTWTTIRLVTNLKTSQENMDSPCPIQPCSSTQSFCISRLSTESSGNDCHNSEISPITGGERSSSMKAKGGGTKIGSIPD